MNTASTTSNPQVAEQTGTAVPAKKPRKRRMARETKKETTSEGENQQPSKRKSTSDAAPRPISKIGNAMGLLQRKEGATLNEMVEATGWLPHTTRAALTGLKKKGHTITKDKLGEATCYFLARLAL